MLSGCIKAENRMPSLANDEMMFAESKRVGYPMRKHPIRNLVP